MAVALRRGSPWGPVLISGVASTLAYNYALISTGRQNLWIFLWVAKLARSGISVCLVWNLLPLGSAGASRARTGIMAYFTVVVMLFSALMGRRLLASANDYAMGISVQVRGPVNWAMLPMTILFIVFAAPAAWPSSAWQGESPPLPLPPPPPPGQGRRDGRRAGGGVMDPRPATA